jgi:hypothetical protein
MSGIRSKQERKMATQNPNRLRTNCPGGSLTLGGDTTVSRLGFGAMRLCGPGVWGEPLDRPGAKRVLMRAVELGITLVDTADAYGPEVNERFNHPLPPHTSIGGAAWRIQGRGGQILDFTQRRLLPALSAAWESGSQSLTID